MVAMSGHAIRTADGTCCPFHQFSS